jgi:hypothetical protein
MGSAGASVPKILQNANPQLESLVVSRGDFILVCRTEHDVLALGSLTVEQSEMSKWAVILLLVHRPFFDFNQAMVGPFDFLQYLLCVWISFALCAVTRKFRSFDVFTKPQYY